MLNFEPIDIQIVLSSKYWKNPPKTKVYLDETLIFDNEILKKTEIRWSDNLPEGLHKLIIELYDKDKYQTVLENGKIVKDQLLDIDEIIFDEIDIGYLKHTLSNYYPDKSNPTAPFILKDCVNLGWNGRWELEFTTPIYIWLLENI